MRGVRKGIGIESDKGSLVVGEENLPVEQAAVQEQLGGDSHVRQIGVKSEDVFFSGISDGDREIGATSGGRADDHLPGENLTEEVLPRQGFPCGS